MIAILSYACYKFYVLEAKKSIDILQAVSENHFDDENIFSGKQGLNFAVAVYNAFIPASHSHIDPSYGRIKISKGVWKRLDNGEYFFATVELNTH